MGLAVFRSNRVPASRKPLHLLQFDVGAISKHLETVRCRAASASELNRPGTKEAHEVQERWSGSPGLSCVCWSQYWSNVVHQQLHRWLYVRSGLAVQSDLRL